MHAMKSYHGSRGIVLLIFNLGTRWPWVVNFIALLLYHRERMGGWVGAVTSLGTLNNKDLFPSLGSEPWTVQPIAWSLFGLQILSYIIHWTMHCSSLHPALPFTLWETAVAQWLRCCATNQEVAGSIPGSVSGFFIDIKSSWSHYGPGVDSASNRNEYQEHFLGVKVAGA